MFRPNTNIKTLVLLPGRVCKSLVGCFKMSFKSTERFFLRTGRCEYMEPDKGLNLGK